MIKILFRKENENKYKEKSYNYMIKRVYKIIIIEKKVERYIQKENIYRNRKIYK